ncbi:MAG: amino acid decarboxylase, partial [Anaerolineales bacterium]
MEELTKNTKNLDPENMDDFRDLAHQMVDDLVDYVANLSDSPVWKPITSQDKSTFSKPVPYEAQGETRTYTEFKEHILNNPMGNLHPRFWGWVMGNGVPLAAFADLFASIMNPNLGGGDHIANYVERQVIDWLKEILDFPSDASGLLVSGGSMANFIGLAVARNTMAGFDIRNKGV